MPTDADWGRLYNFNTSGDAGMVMPFRSYYFRDFFAGGWQNMAIGLIYRNAGNSGDNSSTIAERQDETTPANLFHFGISKSTDGTINVPTNPVFMGLRGYMGGVTQVNPSPTLTLGQLGLTIVNGGITTLNGDPIAIPLKQGTGTDPFAMIGIRFVYNALTNVLTMRYAFDDTVTLADPAANTTILTNFLNGISNDQAGANATFTIYNLTNFSSYFIYWPYLTNKLMLHTVGAIKSA